MTSATEVPQRRACGGETWGFVAISIDDPPRCVNDCREQFLDGLLPKHETLERVCQTLSDRARMDREQPFRALYCCDSQLCGVDNLGSGGKDPNVNWFINACQNIGYHSIIDPGPPEPSYTCGRDLISGHDPRCRKEKSTLATNAAALSKQPSRISMAPAADGISPVSQPTPTLSPIRSSISSSSPSSSPSSNMATSTHVIASDPSLSVKVEANGRSENLDNGQGFSTGVKVTIVLSVLIALVALLALVVYLLRRRARDRSMTTFRRNIKHPDYPPRPPDSPTALLPRSFSQTGADGVPLTPPPRLQERKFLPTSGSPRLSQQSTGSGYPTSPMYAPVATRPLPRHERTPKLYGGPTSPPPPASGAFWARRGESVSSVISAPTTASITSTFGAPLGIHRSSPSSPTRQLRPYDSSIQVQGLASPGPPPNRALPSTPPEGYASPTTPLPDVAYQAPARIAIPQEYHDDPYDFGDFGRRESHQSWGSWSAPEASKSNGPAITVTPPKKPDSPILKDPDLEAWPGRY